MDTLFTREVFLRLKSLFGNFISSIKVVVNFYPLDNTLNAEFNGC